jgi:hypothetical protein
MWWQPISAGIQIRSPLDREFAGVAFVEDPGVAVGLVLSEILCDLPLVKAS